MPRSDEGDYEITASNGSVYHVHGSAKRVQELAQWVNERVAAGDPQLTQGQPPVNTVIDRGRPEVPGANYVSTGGIEGLLTGEGGQRQINRSGVMPSIESVLRGMRSSLTSNFADEITAGMDTIMPFGRMYGEPVKSGWDSDSGGFGDAFAHNLNYQRQLDEADSAQHPYLRGGGQLAGTVIQTLLGARALGAGASAIAPYLPRAAIGPVGAATIAASNSPRMAATVAGVGAGAAQGAAAGLGEGDDMDTRLRNAKVGAGFGAITGGVAAPVVGTLAPAIARYARVLFGRNTEQEAMRQLVAALKNDGFDVASPAGVLNLKNELSSYLGKPVSLADIGAATRGRTGVALRAPSAAQERSIDMVTQRQAGQGQRLIGDIRSTVSPRTDVHALEQALQEQRAQVALPLRDKALFESGPGYGDPALPAQPLAAPTGLATGDAEDAGLRRMLGLNPVETQPTYLPVPAATGGEITTNIGRQSRIVQDPQLQNLARLPMAQAALTRARTLAQNEAQVLAAQGKDFSHLPDLNPGADLDVRTLDYTKRYLDRVVNRLAQGGDMDGYGAAEYNQVKALRDAIRDRMKEVVPDYGNYLDAYSSSKNMSDALEKGRGFTSMDPEEIAAAQARNANDPAAQELFRSGAARKFVDVVTSTKDGGNAASRILNSDEARAQLEATGVSPENLAAINRAIGIERQLNKLPAELGGSQTARRSAAEQAANAGVEIPNVMNAGRPSSWFWAALKSAGRHANIHRNAQVNEAFLPRAIETDPAAIAATIDELHATGKYLEAARLRAKLHAMMASGSLGALAGSAASQSTTEGY